MNTIDQRLDIFVKTGILLAAEKEILLAWIKMIKDHSMNYDEEKLERMITHCAMMMKRQRDHEEIDILPDDLYITVKEHKNYPACLKLLSKMTALYPVNVYEEKYLIMHLCNCFG